jgi:hypothetical protein
MTKYPLKNRNLFDSHSLGHFGKVGYCVFKNVA